MAGSKRPGMDHASTPKGSKDGRFHGQFDQNEDTCACAYSGDELQAKLMKEVNQPFPPTSEYERGGKKDVGSEW